MSATTTELVTLALERNGFEPPFPTFDEEIGSGWRRSALHHPLNDGPTMAYLHELHIRTKGGRVVLWSASLVFASARGVVRYEILDPTLPDGPIGWWRKDPSCGRLLSDPGVIRVKVEGLLETFRAEMQREPSSSGWLICELVDDE